ncbi:hypothetical protein PGT21_029513 [Puccinia graminis f. sp. tritici]|uniref:Uncharacterized protein n=1 Tax=Puccinia graminis f. sp. tritici TaxID=56615 RepID=A0A5B0QCN5_PUCGR|nr:hypothetical protein PGT21_029513 [Puccinia graminis f. sp. tritici]
MFDPSSHSPHSTVHHQTPADQQRPTYSLAHSQPPLNPERTTYAPHYHQAPPLPQPQNYVLNNQHQELNIEPLRINNNNNNSNHPRYIHNHHHPTGQLSNTGAPAYLKPADPCLNSAGGASGQQHTHCAQQLLPMQPLTTQNSRRAPPRQPGSPTVNQYPPAHRQSAPHITLASANRDGAARINQGLLNLHPQHPQNPQPSPNHHQSQTSRQSENHNFSRSHLGNTLKHPLPSSTSTPNYAPLPAPTGHKVQTHTNRSVSSHHSSSSVPLRSLNAPTSSVPLASAATSQAPSSSVPTCPVPATQGHRKPSKSRKSHSNACPKASDPHPEHSPSTSGPLKVSALPNLQKELQAAFAANDKTAGSKRAKATGKKPRENAQTTKTTAEGQSRQPSCADPPSRSQRCNVSGATTDPAPTKTITASLNPNLHVPPLTADLDLSGLQSPPSPDLNVDVNDGAEPSGNVGPTNNADHSDQGDVDSDNQPNDNEGSSGEKRKKLAHHLVKQLYAMDTDTLRDAVRKHGHYTRLVAEDKVELDDAHEEYLKQVYRICGTNLLQIDSVMKYIGQGNRTRGGTMYSYFCQYNPEAVRIKNDSTIPIQQRWSQCGALWRKLSKEEKNLYNDPTYLATLPNPFVQEGDNTTNQPTSETVKGKSARKVAKPSKFDVNRWANKIGTDMVNLSASHAIEGFVVLVYPHQKGRAVLTGGSKMGEAFLDMIQAGPNPVNDFLDFVKGQFAMKHILGTEAPLLTKKRKRKAGKDGVERSKYDKEDNRHEIREQLGYAIYKASNHIWRNGRPGAKTNYRLQKLNLTLRVTENPLNVLPEEFCKRPSDLLDEECQRLLTALGEGWVELLGPKPSNNRTVGAEVEAETKEGSGNNYSEDENRCEEGSGPKKTPPKKRVVSDESEDAGETPSESSEEDRLEEGDESENDGPSARQPGRSTRKSGRTSKKAKNYKELSHASASSSTEASDKDTEGPNPKKRRQGKKKSDKTEHIQDVQDTEDRLASVECT